MEQEKENQGIQMLVLVKIGGSSITDTHKANTAKPAVIRRLAKELKKASKYAVIIVGHGSGSFAHIPAMKYGVHKGLINKNSKRGASITQQVAANLHKIVLKELEREGLNPISFPPSSGVVTRSRKIVEWDIAPLKEAIKHGFTPVTYGDIALDKKLGVTVIPTEEPLRYLAKKLHPSKVIVGGDTDGVFTANPKLDKRAKLIKRINKKNIKTALGCAGASTKIDVTGGMRSKLEYLYDIAKSCGATCQIVNVNKPDRLYSAIIGKETVSTVIKNN